ncbi:hypothetical protein DPMN_048580 [Dreissena polymorpha]|uniref:Uncharacterized protein n=1 Tax=Dreissena polymorpha TaxID=45954 RepID=A0A9D4I0B0_DREPO|nr:hypothetical protein DPMN_048580 [Dreissena polymorpha]
MLGRGKKRMKWLARIAFDIVRTYDRTSEGCIGDCKVVVTTNESTHKDSRGYREDVCQNKQGLYWRL